MIVEIPEIQTLAYYLGLLALFGIGFEFIALKFPTFIKSLNKEALRDILLAFLNSWQFGFLLMFIAALFVSGILGDLLFFLGLGIAIPDLPKRFRRYYKYILLIIALSGILPPWLESFFRNLSGEASTNEGNTDTGAEKDIEWGEPDYWGGKK